MAFGPLLNERLLGCVLVPGHVRVHDRERDAEDEQSRKLNENHTKHCYCRECDRFFVNSEALGQHSGSPVHAMQFHCCDPKVSSFRLSNWVCEQCEREFKDKKELEQNRLSVAHKPLSDIKCIGDRRCKKQFTSPSAWLHHLESGACPSKMMRDKLHSAVQLIDVNRLITGRSIQECIDLKSLARTAHLSNEDQAVDDVHDILKAYYKVALKRFTDNIVIQVVERCYLISEGPVKSISAESTVWNVGRRERDNLHIGCANLLFTMDWMIDNGSIHSI